MRSLIVVLFMFLLSMPKAFPLAKQNIQFADGVTFNPTHTTQWYEIGNFHYIDFTVVATAGDGTMLVEYSSDRDGESAIEDAVQGAFDTTEASSLIAAGIGKFYVRLTLTCVTPPCTFSGWFTAKGMMP